MRRRRAGCSACCATSTAISTTRRPTPRCPRRWAAVSGPVLPGGAPVPVRPHRRGHLGGRPGRGRQGDGGEALRERSRQRPGTQRDDAEVLPGGRHLPGRPLARPRAAQQRARGPVRQLDDRAVVQPHPSPASRSRWPRRSTWPTGVGSTTGPARSATWCRTTCCRCWPPCWPTRRMDPGWTIRGWTRRRASWPRCATHGRRRRPGQYEGYRDVDGVDRTRPPRATSRFGWPWTRGGGPACRSSSEQARRCR